VLRCVGGLGVVLVRVDLVFWIHLCGGGGVNVRPNSNTFVPSRFLFSPPGIWLLTLLISLKVLSN